MKTTLALLTILIFSVTLFFQQKNSDQLDFLRHQNTANELAIDQPAETPILKTESDEFQYELTFSRGNTAKCKRLEGEYKTVYYNGPLLSLYPCSSETKNDVERKLLILKDVEFSEPLTINQMESGALNIKRKSTTPSPVEPDQWTYEDIKVEKMETPNEYQHKTFTRIEISYTEETHHNSFFVRN